MSGNQKSKTQSRDLSGRLGTRGLTRGDLSPEVDSSPQDLLVLLEGDVPADHVIEQHAERPDGGRAAVISVRLDPLWRTIDPRTWRDKGGSIRHFKYSTVFNCDLTEQLCVIKVTTDHHHAAR